jgi:hypothetical protein
MGAPGHDIGEGRDRAPARSRDRRRAKIKMAGLIARGANRWWTTPSAYKDGEKPKCPGSSVSPATAKTHVSRVMGKLRARDRAQLVVIAYESGLARPGWSG